MRLHASILAVAVACATFPVAQAQLTSNTTSATKLHAPKWELSGGVTSVFLSDGQRGGTVQRAYTWSDQEGNEFFRWGTTNAYGITANLRYNAVGGLGINLGYEYLFRNHEIDGGTYDAETGRLKVFPTQGRFFSVWAKTSSVPITLDYRFALANGIGQRGAYIAPYVSLGIDQYEHNRYWRDAGISYTQGAPASAPVEQRGASRTSVDVTMATTFGTRAVWYPSLRYGARIGQDFGKWGTWELELGYRDNPWGRLLDANDMQMSFEHTQFLPYSQTDAQPDSGSIIRNIRGSYDFPLYIGGVTSALRWVVPLGRDCK